MAWEYEDLCQAVLEEFEDACDRSARPRRVFRDEDDRSVEVGRMFGIPWWWRPPPRSIERKQEPEPRPNEVVCSECGASVPVKGSGHLPVVCSSLCRTRRSNRMLREAADASPLRRR